MEAYNRERMKQEKQYYAFISYKREDEKWAKWLQNKLEHYRFPTNLNGQAHLPKYIRPTFRDVTDLSPGLLAEEIYNALHNSEWLIVICSPRSAKSPWVCKEAQMFIDLGRADHIIPFVIEGTPFSDDISTECYPEALLKLTGSNEILAANINEMGHDAAAIKVISRMFNLRFDDLWKRYERERMRKMWMWVSGSILLALLGLSISVFFFWLNRSIKEQKQHIESQNKQLGEAYWNMMYVQSKAVSEKAMKLIGDGDSYTASMLALSVLPENLQFPNRPFCVEAERALRFATSHNSTVLRGHIDKVNTAFFNHNGTMIVSASDDGTIKIWNSESGLELITLDASAGFVSSAAFSPNDEKIVAGYKDCAVRIWDVKTRTVFKTLKGHTGNILSCSYSHNGKYIVSSAGGDNTIRLWDAYTGKILRIFIGHTDVHNSVSFSPDDKYVVSAGGMDDKIRIWDLATGKEVQKFPCNSIYSVSYSNDGGKIVASSSGSNSSQIFDIKSGGKVLSLRGHTDYVEYSSFSHDDKYIATASLDRRILLWDAKGDKLIRELNGHTSGVNSVSFDSNGDRLVSASSDKTIRVWDLYEDKESKILKGDHGYISCADINPKGDIIVSSSRSNGVLCVWDKKSGKVMRMLNGHTGFVFTVAFSPDGKKIMSAATDNTIRLWNAHDGTLQQTIICGNYLKGIASFSPDGKLIAYGDGTVLRIIDASTGKLLKKYCARKDGKTNVFAENISSIAFNCNGKHVATAAYGDMTIRVWNMETDSVVRVFNGHRNAVTSISFNPKGNRLVSAAYDGTVRIWGMEKDNYEIMRIDGEDFHSVSYSPDGKYISVGGWPDLHVLDAETGVEVQLYKGHTSGINSVKYSSNGRNIISSSEDGSIRIWNFPPLQELIDKTRTRFKNRKLTLKERRRYYLE